MQSITLQTNDSIVASGDALGQVQFAASNELDGGASRYIVGRIYGEAEGTFTASSNPASIVFATSAADSLPASGKIKISHEGHILPLQDNAYDLGSTDFRFRDLYVTSEVTSPSGNFDQLFFNTGIGDIDQVAGQLNWNNEAGTLELGLTNDLKIQVGQTVLFRIKNSTGSTLSKGQAVYASGVLGGGQIIQAAPFAADESVDEVRFIGLMADDLANGEDGYVNHFGHIKNVDLRTSNTAVNPNGETWAVGDILYVDGTTPGGLTKVPPQDDIYVALVLETGQNGELFVRITDPGHMTDLHDVNFSGLVDNNLMVWNSGANYWEPTTSMTFDGTTLHTDTDGITAIFGRNNAQTVGGKVRIYVDDNDTANSVQAIKAFNAKTTGTNYGINATANGLGATKNVGLYGWAAQATTNWGLWVDAGYGIFDDRVGIGISAPSGALHVVGEAYVDNLKLDGNTLSSTDSNGNIYITPNGTGGVAGGSSTTVTSSYGTVGGGFGNISSGGSWSTVGGGRQNTASNNYTTIGGGCGNCANTLAATVAGGFWNKACGSYASVGGGRQNTASGGCSVVAGGISNTASGPYSSVLGGQSNSAGGGGRSAVVNGYGSSACYFSFVGNGYVSKAHGNVSSVTTGCYNYACADFSSIVGGRANEINPSGTFGFIGGGDSNLICGNNACYATIGGGYDHTASNAYATVGGGRRNCVLHSYGTVAGGNSNVACFGGTVAGGRLNCSISNYSSITGGNENTASGYVSTIGGGYQNRALCQYSAVVGGLLNVASGDYSAVVAGSGNLAGEACSFVGGGVCHTASGITSFIGGGLRNTTSGYYNVVVGGSSNRVYNWFSAIGGGKSNTASCYYSTIAGGWGNTVLGGGGFIGAGISNDIGGVWGGVIGGGADNTVSASYGIVVGGCCNTINASGACSFIGGGCRNTSSGSYSAILGGKNNSDGGCSSVFILGTGITATSANTTYTQKLNVSHTTEPSGTLFNVEGSNGSLFSVVDNLSGVLMSVNNNAGLPVFEVYDDDSIVAGRFNQNDFVITTSGDIGIGTANPTEKLDIRYSAGGGMALLKSTDSNDGLLLGDMALSSDNNYQGIKHAAMTGVNEYMIISSGTDTFVSAGYNGKLYLRAGNNDWNSSVSLTSSEVVVNEFASSRDFRVESNNNANMLFVDGVANMVGIGTNAPASKLHVYDSSDAQVLIGTNSSFVEPYSGFNAQNISALQILQTSNAYGAQIHLGASGVSSGTTIGGISFLTTGTSASEKRGAIIASTLISTSTTAVSSDLNFWTNNAGSITKKMTIAADGNVGIGIASPTQKLHIQQNSTSNLVAKLEQENASYESWYEANSQDNGYARFGISSNSNDYAFFNTDQASYRWYTIGTERMRLTSGGNVGIGTTSPSYKLHVAGDISANANNIYGGGFAVYGDANNKLTKSGNDFTLSAGQTTTDVHLGYYDGGTLNKVLTVDSSEDRVGILNTTPAYTLDVTGSGNFTGNLYTGGNLGVGTTSPSSKLHVMGGARLQGDSTNTTWTSASATLALKNIYSTPFISFHTNAGARIGYFQMDSTNAVTLGVEQNLPLRFTTNNLDRMRITADGNVGIGTTSPSYKLDVNGTSNLGGDVIVGGNLTVNGTTISTNVDTIEIQDPIITLGLTSGNIVTNDSYDRGIAMVTNDGTAFMGWDNSADKFVMLSSGVATNGSGNYDAGTYGDLEINELYTHNAVNIQQATDDENAGLIIKNANGIYSNKLYANSYNSVYKSAGDFTVNLGATNRGFYISHAGSAAWEMNKDYIRPYSVAGSASIFAGDGGYFGFAQIGNTLSKSVMSLHNWTGNYDYGVALYYRASGVGVGLTKGLVLDNRGRVGINDETPSYQLDVNGTTQILPTAATDTLILGRSTGYASVTSTTSNELILDSDGAYTSLNHYSSDDVILGYGGGNVGIGTATPTDAMLHINSTSTLSTIKLERGTTSQNNMIKFRSANADRWIVGQRNIPASEDFKFYSYATSSDVFTISTGGNVGIGTTGPVAKLDVRGSAVFNEGGADYDFRVEGSGSPNALFVDGANGNVGIGTDAPPDKLSILAPPNSLVFGAKDTTRNNHIFQLLADDSAGNGELRLYSNSSVGTHTKQVEIASQGSSYFLGGNVGVGTSSPVSKLDVSGVITATGGNSDEWNQAYDWIQNSGLDGTGSASGVAFWTDANTLSYDSGLTWDSTNGRLGIQTTSPSNYLTIGGSLNSKLKLTGGFAQNSMRFDGVGGGDTFDVFSDSNGLNINDGTSTIFTAANNGNVGIGTTSPTEKLQVVQESASSTVYLDVKNSSNVISSPAGIKLSTNYLGTVKSSLIYDNWTGAGMTFQASRDLATSQGGFNWVAADSTSMMVLRRASSNNWLGLNTTSPTQTMDIRYPTGGGMALLKSTDTTDGLLFGDMAYSASNDWQGMKHAAMNGSADYMIISNGTDTYVSSAAGGNTFICAGANSANSTIRLTSTEVVVNDYGSSNDFRVESDNNANMLFVDGVSDKVGIGTGSPAYTLDVSGTGNIPSIITTQINATNGWGQALTINNSNGSGPVVIKGPSGYSTTAGVVIQPGIYEQATFNNNSGSRMILVSTSGEIGFRKMWNLGGEFVFGGANGTPNVDAGHVLINGGIGGFSDINNSNGGNVYLQAGIANSGIGGGSDGEIYIRNPSGTNMHIFKSNGNVGIGTTSPSTQLDVVGSGNFSGDVTISGHLSAATKSFYIDHPTKEGKLQYGSLESPYHGIRLTGRGKIDGGKCVVDLPDYISALVRDDENVNIQITNYKHSKILYVDDIDISNNCFTVKCDSWFGGGKEFFWSFTAVRKDVQELKVEC